MTTLNASLKMLCIGFLTTLTLSAQQYVVSTIAGGVPPPTPAAAVSSSFGNTNSTAIDPAGNLYFSAGQCVYKVDSTGKLTVIAGNSRRGYSGDGGLGINAQLYDPYGVAVDSAGNVYIADELNNRIRKVTPAGIITTVAGSGTAGFSGDGGAAVQAQLHFPLNVAVDSAGNLYIADNFNFRIRRVSPAGIIVTVGGGGTTFPGDGGLATAAVIAGPSGMTIDASGDIIFADRNGMRVRKISPGGIISTIAGNGTPGYSGDGGAAINAELYLPSDVVVDSGGNLYIADFNNNFIRKVSSAGIISTVPMSAVLNGPSGVALDSSGNLYIADRFNNRILRVTSTGAVSPTAGGGSEQFSGDSGTAVNAQLYGPAGVAVDGAGNLYIADAGNNRIRAVSPAGIITTVAGNGNQSFSGDGALAVNAGLNNPQAVAVDSGGNLYIADRGNNRVRKITGGVISTVAGTGTSGVSGDGGLATNASLAGPSNVAIDGVGNLYILDAGNGRVREVSPAGVITTIFGSGTSGQPPLPTAPNAIAVDASGNLFIAETFQIQKISATGIVSTISQAGGTSLAVDASGNLYVVIADAIERVVPPGILVPTAGNGVAGYLGDGGPALNAEFNGAAGMAIDSAGRIYAADSGNNSVRLMQPVNQSVIVAAVVNAASESANPVSPGQIVVIYGGGLGPPQAITNQPVNGVFGTNAGGTSVYFNAIPAPILYTSATQITAIVPYGISGSTVQLTVVYQGQVLPAFAVPVAASAPSLFTSNQTGAGQAAAINDVDGTLNGAANPVKIGAYVSLFATGEGQTTPAGVDGKTGGTVATHPNANVTATVGGLPATVQYDGGVFGDVAGLMQVNVQIPAGVTPGGYVPVVLTVGTATSNAGTWIAVAGN